ncbi:MAG: hypothetical protein ACJ74L_04095 [Gaiellaceae bacterium]
MIRQPHSHRTSRPSADDALNGAVLAVLAAAATLTWRRGRIREVEAELISPHATDEGAASQPVPEELDGRAFALVPDRVVEEADDPEERPADEHPLAEAEAEEEAEAEPDAEPEPEPTPVARLQQPPPPPTLSTEEWACEIALWRDHDAAVFYARSFHDDEEVLVAESTRFQLQGRAVPARSHEALAAHTALCDELVRTGWKHVGEGEEWYSDRFRRDFDAAALNASLTTRITYANR